MKYSLNSLFPNFMLNIQRIIMFLIIIQLNMDKKEEK